MGEKWVSGRLKDLIDHLESGVSVNGEDRPTGKNEPAVLKVSAVTNGVFDPDASKPIQKRDLHRARCNPKAGQIIISRSNTPALVGASAYIDRDYPDRFLPDKLWQTTPKKEHAIDMKWLSYYLASPKARFWMSSLATGTSKSMKNITKGELLSLPVLTPPLKEQTAIVDLLGTWDQAIGKMEQLIEAKERHFLWLTTTLINNQCRHWNHLRVRSLFKRVSERSGDNVELLSATQDRGVIPRTMLKGRVMSPQGSTASYKLVREGDFVVSLRSFEGGLEYSRYQGLISPAYTILRPASEINADFYRHFFKSYLFVHKYLNIAVIGIRDGKQISIPDFMTVKIPYPPLDRQRKVACTLDTARQEINLLKQQAAAYRKQKRGLMQKLLTGVWRVNVRADGEGQTGRQPHGKPGPEGGAP